jgi:Domain of unknown function (DUF3459)
VFLVANALYSCHSRLSVAYSSSRLCGLARGSLLNFYRRLIQLRRDTAVLRVGDYQPCAVDPFVYAYHRRDVTDDVLIAANFSDCDRRYADRQLPARGDRLLSSAGRGGGEVELGPLHLRPLEATVIRLASG